MANQNKTNLLPRFILTAFLLMLVVPLFGLAVFAGAPKIAQASNMSMNLQIPIPTLNGGEKNIKFTADTGPIAAYIKAIYTYAIGIVGILAAVVMMAGGLMWITAGGNTSNIGEAKAMITASLTGLVLALTSYLILSNVNPALTDLSKDIIAINPPPTTAAMQSNSTCTWIKDQQISTGLTGFGGSAGTMKCDARKGQIAGSCTDASPGSDYTCCCTFTPLPGCTFSNALCELEEKTYEFGKSNDQATREIAIKKCGSSGNNELYCCCVESATGTSDCSTCNTLESSGFTLNSACSKSDAECQADKTLISKLSSFSSGFIITGAWPPTSGIHEIGCHDKGTCVDIAPSTGDASAFNTLARNLSSTGVAYIQFECPTSGCCSDYQTDPYNLSSIPCTVNGTGNHFHVQLYAKGQ